jgi:DNA polymerase-1
MKKLYVIDAVNYLFRSYYAIGPMMNQSGQSTSALFGFVRSVQKLIRDFGVEHLVCVFDGPDNKKSRRAVYADYKAHRKGAPEDLFPQFELAEQYCALAGISTLCVDGCEADDVMASIAVWAREKNADVYLCSSDKDLMQLVDKHTFVLQQHKENLVIDETQVEQIWGVKPTQMLDLLAITGDASDNIPGIEGFGPKTAASLLQQFGTLDAILAHPEKVKGEKKQELLRTNKEIALMSRQLATLDVLIPIPHTEAFYHIKPIDREPLTEFFHSMRFNSLLKEAANEPAPPKHKPHIAKRDYILVDNQETLATLWKTLEVHKEVCLDTETNEGHPLLTKLVGIGFGVEPGLAWYVPAHGKLGQHRVQAELKRFFAHTKCAFYGHNIKYDWHILANMGIELKPICFDTMLASYLLQPQNHRHNLDQLALETFNKVKIPYESLTGKGKQKKTLLEAPIEAVKDYCCEDVDYTCQLKAHFEKELHAQKLDRLLHEIELPLLPILAKMERQGIYIDSNELHGLNLTLGRKLGALKTTIFQQAGVEFNLNSPKQLSEVLYQKLQLKPPRKQKSEFSTSADVLEDLLPQHPVIAHILQYRTLEKLRSTYAESLPLQINPTTSRIHCTFNQSMAATGRLSCQDPNLQNIPVRTTEGLAIRACFKPENPTWQFVGADYSQIELRLLAHFSQDPELLRAFRNGEDIHTHTATLLFNVPKAEVTPEMRNRSKTVNFGVLYGQGPFALSTQLGISMQEAAQFIKTYFERYPRVSQFFEQCKEEVRKTGSSKTLTGRRRPIPEMTNKNPSIRSAAERLAVNTPLQGTAADLIKMAMIQIDQAIDQKKLKGSMILQIHDELIFEVPPEETAIFKHLVKEKMENVFSLEVPIEVHISVGKNWAEC